MLNDSDEEPGQQPGGGGGTGGGPDPMGGGGGYIQVTPQEKEAIERVSVFHVPSTEGEGGHNWFWCGSRQRRCPRCSLSALYLLNQWVDFHQTCTGTLLGGRKEVIR